MGGRRAVALHRGMVLVVAAPAAWVLWRAGTEVTPLPRSAWPLALVLVVLHALARRTPVRLSGPSASVQIDTSVAFGFALLLSVPHPVAVLALAASAVVPTPDRAGTRWLHSVVDVGRSTLVYAAGAAVLSGLGDGVGRLVPALVGGAAAGTSELLLVLLPAGLVAFLVDVTLRSSLTAAEQGATLRAVLRQDHGWTELAAVLVLVGLSPAILIIGETSLVLTPLLLVALLGLYRSSRANAVQQHEARHDPLTGLANRRVLEARLDALVATADLDDPVALLLMDLDRFKEVNDRLGHHVGDALLAQVGSRLRHLDGVDVAARIGGDEFAFLLRRTGAHDELVALGERLVAEVSRPYVVDDVRLSIGASVGIASYPEHGLDGASLLRRADAAMYAAKRGGVAVGVATVQRGASSPGRFSLLGELEEAMAHGQLRLDYQPQVDLRTGEVAGVESLLRWHHPEHGLVPPSAFVTTVEHTELIAPLTRHVLGLALDDAVRWEVAGVTVPVAVNISARDLADPRFPSVLDELLATYSFPPRELTLEITETALQLDPERAHQTLAELRELGVALSIDDFGTGYSSLAMLRDLPVTELKIDRTFVQQMDAPAGIAIVRSVTQLAHAIGLRVVAEGVEQDADLWELRTLGCDIGQGFLISHPLPAHMVAPWVRARREELRTARSPFQAAPEPDLGPRRARIRAV